MATDDGMNMRATLVGGPELKAKLGRLMVDADEIALAGLMAGGEVIRKQAVTNITDQGLVLSGTLRRSIHVTKDK